MVNSATNYTSPSTSPILIPLHQHSLHRPLHFTSSIQVSGRNVNETTKIHQTIHIWEFYINKFWLKRLVCGVRPTAPSSGCIPCLPANYHTDSPLLLRMVLSLLFLPFICQKLNPDGNYSRQIPSQTLHNPFRWYFCLRFYHSSARNWIWMVTTPDKYLPKLSAAISDGTSTTAITIPLPNHELWW